MCGRVTKLWYFSLKKMKKSEVSCDGISFDASNSVALCTQAGFSDVLEWASCAPVAALLVLLSVTKSMGPSKRHQSHNRLAGPPPPAQRF